MTSPPVTDAPSCPACDEPLRGRYCHACGQDTRIGPHPLRELIAEGVEEITELDGKMVRSLSALVLQPGRLLSAYRSGASQLFVTPLKLFIVSTAFFLAVLSLTDVVMYQNVVQPIDPGRPIEIIPDPTGEWSRYVNVSDRIVLMQPRVDPPVSPELFRTYDALIHAAASPTERENLRLEVEATREQVVVSERLTAWLPNALWILMPFYALLLAPFFGRRRLFMEHLAFSMWAHAMAFTWLIALALLNSLGVGMFVLPLIVPYLTYFTMAASRYYELPWQQALWRGVAHFVLYCGLGIVPASIVGAFSVMRLGI